MPPKTDISKDQGNDGIQYLQQVSNSVNSSGSDGGGSGGSGGGGGGGSSSSSSHTESTTTTNMGPDAQQQANLVGTEKARLGALRASTNEDLDEYKKTIAANEDIWKNDTLAARRDSGTDWYTQQQKLQNAYSMIRDANQLGAYTGGGQRLNYLTSVSDDISDQELLNTLRNNLVNIDDQRFENDVKATNAINHSLIEANTNAINSLADFVSQYGNLTGNTQTNYTVTDQDTSTDSDGDSSTSTSTSTTTSDITQESNPNKFIWRGDEGDWIDKALMSPTFLSEVFGDDFFYDKNDPETILKMFQQKQTNEPLTRRGYTRSGNDTTTANRLQDLYGRRMKEDRY